MSDEPRRLTHGADASSDQSSPRHERIDAREMLRLVPPNSLFEVANSWMLLELMDRRRSRHDERLRQRQETQGELTEVLQRRAMQIEAFTSLVIIILLQSAVWVMTKLRLLPRVYHDRLIQARENALDFAADRLEGGEAPFEKQEDELAAAKLLNDRTAFLTRLRARCGDSDLLSVYLLRFEEAAMSVGQRLAEAALRGRRASLRAEFEASLFRSSLTSFGAMISLGAFVKTALFAVLAFFGVYFLMPDARGEQPIALAAKLLSAAVAATVALAISALRLFFGFRRMIRIQKDAQRRGAEARLEFHNAERAVAVDSWHDVVSLYEMLADRPPPPEVDQAQRDRLRRIDQSIRREEAEVVANTPDTGIKRRVRGMFEGMLQGDVGDAF